MKKILIISICTLISSCSGQQKNINKNLLIGNWQLIEINKLNPKLEYEYRELFIDNKTINTIMDIGLAKVRHYEIKDDILYIDQKQSELKIVVESDYLFFYKGPLNLTKFKRIKKGHIPKDYIEAKNKNEESNYWIDFNLRKNDNFGGGQHKVMDNVPE